MSRSPYLLPGKFIESDDRAIVGFAHDTVGDASDDLSKALRLFYRVRDEILYDPYLPMGVPESYSARVALATGRGWCVPKSALLTACARAVGIPARPGFADVMNHLSTPKMRAAMGTDVFSWHSYTELWLDGKWVKATPAFNKSMCDRFGLKALDFDGRSDSLFHPFDKAGHQHMEYIRDRGTYQDIPFEEILATFARHYRGVQSGIEGDFQQEAGKSRTDIRS